MREIQVRYQEDDGSTIHGYLVEECPITGKEQDVKICSHWDLCHCNCYHFKGYTVIAGNFIVLCDPPKKPTKKEQIIAEIRKILNWRHVTDTVEPIDIGMYADRILAIVDEK